MTERDKPLPEHAQAAEHAKGQAMTEPKPLLPLTSREMQCAIARTAMHVDPFDGAMASCSWIFRLRGEWSRTPTSQEVAAMLEEMRREPERAPVTAARAIDVLEVVEERDRCRALNALELARLHGRALVGAVSTCQRCDEMERERIKQQVRMKMLSERWVEGACAKLLLSKEWVTDGRECATTCLFCHASYAAGHAEDCEAFGVNGALPPDVRAAAMKVET